MPLEKKYNEPTLGNWNVTDLVDWLVVEDHVYDVCFYGLCVMIIGLAVLTHIEHERPPP